IKTVNDLTSLAPGLSVQNTSGNRTEATYSIRGQGQTYGQEGPGVVTYFAEVPDFASAIFDMQSIQVLKGPQGTLFGRNTTGGAILFTPREPQNAVGGYLVWRRGEYDRQDFEGAIGGAIVPDKVMVRIAGQILKRDGYTRNAADGSRFDDEDRKAFRASILLAPFDGFRNLTIVQQERVDESGSGQTLGGIVQTVNNAPLYADLQRYLAEQRAGGPRYLNSNWAHFNEMKSWGVANTTDIELSENIALKNIASYRRKSKGQAFDLDASPLPLLESTQPSGEKKSPTYTEEIQLQGRFGSVSSVLGFYYEKSKKPLDVLYNAEQYFSPLVLGSIDSALGAAFPGGAILNAVSFEETESSSRAFYTQHDWQASERLMLTAGVRHTEDKRSSFGQTFLLL